MNILNFTILDGDVTVTNASTKKEVAKLHVNSFGKITKFNMQVTEGELTLNELLSLHRTIVATLKDMLRFQESDSQVADCLYWSQTNMI